MVSAGTLRVQKRMIDPLELETGSWEQPDRGAENQTQILSRAMHAFQHRIVISSPETLLLTKKEKEKIMQYVMSN